MGGVPVALSILPTGPSSGIGYGTGRTATNAKLPSSRVR